MFNYIGKHIYYLKDNGYVILDTGESKGFVLEFTEKQDWEIYSELKKYNKEAVDCIRLEYGQYRTEFNECTSYKVNTETKKIEFDYLEKDSQNQIKPAPTLHERVAAIEKSIEATEELTFDNAFKITCLELGNQ